MTQPPIILLYHRVGSAAHDPWQLSVSKDNLLEQLVLLSKERDVVPLSWLAHELKQGRVPQGTAALTFDDGYADVLINGKPLLEKHNCPATAFLATGFVGDRKGFWWDVLAHIILETALLPDRLTLEVRGNNYSWQLNPGAQNPMLGKTSLKTHTPFDLYLAVWKILKPLRLDERLSILEELAAWAGTHACTRERDRCLRPEELRRMVDPGFIDIGAHTVAHPSLPTLSAEEKRQEIVESRKACEELTGSLVQGFAYPFGDLDDSSASEVHAAGFAFACTTAGVGIGLTEDTLRLPRIHVCNWDANEFDRNVLRRYSAPFDEIT
jgi:peptidoglycan/xylan/chitin deacetylase (PgdA/CDA1 family)